MHTNEHGNRDKKRVSAEALTLSFGGLLGERLSPIVGIHEVVISRVTIEVLRQFRVVVV